MNASQIERLPYEAKLEVIKKLPLESIRNLCKTSKTFNNLCNSEQFWQDLFFITYGTIQPQPISWKQLFNNYYDTYGYGQNIEGDLGLGDWNL